MVCVISTRSSRVSADPSSRRNLAPHRSSLGVRGQRRDETRKVGPVFRGVVKRIGSGKIVDIGCVEAGRRVVDANGALEAKLRGSVRETGDCNVIAEEILRPGQLARFWSDFEFGFEHLLVVVITRTQHHPVLAECDRLPIVIGRDVPDGENRHCGSTIIHAPITCNFRARKQCLCTIAGAGSVSADERDAG
jgi:hypothetical protein